MANTTYRLEQTGPQLQEAINQVPQNTSDINDMKEQKQDVLTFDEVPTTDSQNPVRSGGVKAAIDAVGQGGSEAVAQETERARQAEQALAGAIATEQESRQEGDTALQNAIAQEQQRAEGAEGDLEADIADINDKIPAAASPQNQLADKEFVNSSIQTATADFKGTFPSLADLQRVTANNNDYGYVVSRDAEGNTIYSRYKYVEGTGWVFEYTLNNSSFTAAQWAAIQSGITSLLVAKLLSLPAYGDLMALFGSKQDVLNFDTTPTANSNNPVYSGGIKHALDDKQDTLTFDDQPVQYSHNPVKSGGLYDLFRAITQLIPEQATQINQLADKAFVNSSIETSTAEFRGTYNSVAELEQVVADKNDYAFVIATDAEGNTVYKRYKYTEASGWTFEYDVNNTSFTAAQWAAIQSGITAVLVSKLSALPTASDLRTALDAKQDELTFDPTPRQGSTNPVTSDGIWQAIAAATGIEFVPVATLPTASAETLGKIYLVPVQGDPTAKNWYVTIVNAETTPATYEWQQVNTSSVDLSDYYTKEETDLRLSEKNVTVETNTPPTSQTLTYTSKTGLVANHIPGDKRIVPNQESTSGFDIYFLACIQNGAATWIQGGGGGEGDVNEKVYINLTSNQAGDTSLNGLSVRVETAGGETLLDTTWYGEQLFCRVAPLTQYTVTVGTKEGYYLESATQQFESVISGINNVTFAYSTTIVKFLPTSNQGTGDTAIEQATGTINGTAVGYGGTKKVVPGTQVVVIANPLTNYTAPARYEATAEGTDMQPSMLYQTTLVTVTWESNLGTDAVIDAVRATVAGRTVSSGETIKVATGTTVGVVFPDVQGYRKPVIADFTAEGTAVTKPVVQYSTDIYTVSIDSNQQDKSDISGVKVSVSDGTETKQLASGDTIKIPTGTTPEPTAPDLSGYHKALDVSVGNKTITLLYSTTLVSISATSNQGADPALDGLTFTINGTEVAANVSVKIPTGDTLTITAPTLTNYARTIVSAETAQGTAYIVQVAYRTTRVYVNMASSVAGVEGAAPADARATVSYQGGTPQIIQNGQPAYVPTETEFTITYSDAEGYGKPGSYSGTATGASMTATKAVYVSGSVSISPAMSDGDAQALALAGATLSIDGGEAIEYEGTPIPVSPGSQVVVTFKPVEGYQTPQPQTFIMPSTAYTVSGLYQTNVYTVYVTSNQSQDTPVVAQLVSISYTGLTNPVTRGNGQTIKVPANLTPEATAPDVARYAKAVSVNTQLKTITAAYETTVVSVNMVSMTEGTEGAAPEGAGGTVRYTGGTDQHVDNSTVAKVPTGTAFTIDYDAVSNYATPDSYQGTAANASMQADKATYVYGALKLDVTMSDQDDTDLAIVEATIAINGGTPQPMTGTVDTATHKKTFTAELEVGDSYVVAFAPVEGYDTPASISGTKGTGVEQLSASYQTTVYTVAVTSNQADDTDITSLLVTIRYTGLQTPVTRSNGQTIKVPASLTPEATAPDATHYAKTISVDSQLKTITAAYATTKVNLQMVGVNGGVEGSYPTGAQGTVTYEDDQQQTVSQTLTDNVATASVPTGKTFTVTYAAVSGYGTPVTQQLTATGAAMQATKASYVYGLLAVEVIMSDSDNLALADVAATIAINGGTPQPMTGTVDTTTHKKVFQATLDVGDGYVVAFSTVEGYATPASISGTKQSGVETVTAEYATDIYTLTVSGQSRQETIEYEQGGQTVSKPTASGNAVKVPAGTVPTVASAYVKGYARTVVIGTVTAHAATITVTYETTPVSVTIQSNQTGDTTISALRATIAWTYDGHTETETDVASGQQVNVPTGVTPTVTFAEAPTGYSRSVSGKTATYSTMRLTVSLASDTGEADLSGVTVTVTDTTASVPVAPASGVYLIPSGHDYEVSVSDDVEGYSAPSAATGTATATQDAAATVTMTYEEQAGFVDLGLTSGTKWAQGNLVKNGSTYAIGAETDYGTYVSWGNIDGHNEGEGYDFSDANYNSSAGKAVGADILPTDTAHDICRARLGGNWHLPTKEQFQELYDETDREWQTNYGGVSGLNGWKFMKKSDHSVYVFFPASGRYEGTTLNVRGTRGFYWSASWYSDSDAYSLNFFSSSVYPQDYDLRRYGYTVRPVQ